MAPWTLQQMHYEMEDLIEQANEVQESMSRTYGVPDEVDEADLEAGWYSFLHLCASWPVFSFGSYLFMHSPFPLPQSWTRLGMN